MFPEVNPGGNNKSRRKGHSRKTKINFTGEDRGIYLDNQNRQTQGNYGDPSGEPPDSEGSNNDDGKKGERK